MKLSDYRETYYEFSGKASDVTRQLAFAGIAIVWIFKIEEYLIHYLTAQGGFGFRSLQKEFYWGAEYTPILGENVSIRISVLPSRSIVSGRSPRR